MLAWVTVANEFLSPRVQILLADLDAFAKRRRCGLIENLDAATGAACDFDSVESWPSLGTAWTDGPDLARWQRISLDGLVAMQFWRRHELLYAFGTERE